jgi:uncharacterized protein YjbK
MDSFERLIHQFEFNVVLKSLNNHYLNHVNFELKNDFSLKPKISKMKKYFLIMILFLIVTKGNYNLNL